MTRASDIMKYSVLFRVLSVFLFLCVLLSCGDIYAQESLETAVLNHFDRGVFFYRNGHLLASAYEFTEMTELKPEIAATYYNLGVIEHKRNNFKGAEKFYQKAVKLNPDIVECQINLGIVYLEMEQYKRAIEHFKHASLLNPQNANNHYRLAMAYREAGEHDLADSAYYRSLAINPELQNEEWSPELAGTEHDYIEPLKELTMKKPEEIITDASRFFRIVQNMNLEDLYFSKKFQIGFSSGPSFPENYYYKRLSESPDRLSFSGYIGLVMPRKSNFLGAFGGDGYGFVLKARYTNKKSGANEWTEIGAAANIRFYENIDSRGRGKFFIAFGPGLYLMDMQILDEEETNIQVGVEGGAGFDYMILPFVSAFIEGTYAFTYPADNDHTNSLGYIHIGTSLRF
ncbi:MAG: tetratricopeptide repeat protein [candidate division Zixibacteria bacterium]|nr:tetratricopeptide repeat protein [candidate division Zixibacteria bacterium]